MNWTAIVVLLIANAFLGYLVWCAEERASSSYLGAREAKNEARFALEEMYKAQAMEEKIGYELAHEKALHQRLLAKNQRKQEKVKVNPGSVGATDTATTQTEQYNAPVPGSTGRIRDVDHSHRIASGESTLDERPR